MNFTKYNPYFPNGINPYQSLKTPDQYKQDILAQLSPQFENYNAYYAQAQMQASAQASMGQYVKASTYDEVKAVQCPASGKPILIIDEANGVLYSKKFENGQEYIKSFKLAEMEQPQPKQENDPLNLILEKLDNFDKRLSAVENVNTTSVTEPIKTE